MTLYVRTHLDDEIDQGGARARLRGGGTRDRARREGVADDGRRRGPGRRRCRARRARSAQRCGLPESPARCTTSSKTAASHGPTTRSRTCAICSPRTRRCRSSSRCSTREACCASAMVSRSSQACETWAARRSSSSRAAGSGSRSRSRSSRSASFCSAESPGCVRVGKSGARDICCECPLGEGVLGRVVDAVGQPLDGRGPVVPAAWMPVERPAPGIVDRRPVDEPLHTGMKVIDALVPVGRGQRELIIGDRKIGKTTLAVDAILAQKGANVSCIYCAIGQKASTVRQVVATLEERGALEYTAVVVALPDDMPALRYLAPYAACALGEYFMDRGGDALVVYDDLTKHAVTYREMSALLDRPVGREAYPGDIFYVHSRLLERAARLSEERGSGSLTALPIVETLAGDISGVHPDQRHLDLRRTDRARHRRVQREPSARDGSRAVGVASWRHGAGARDEAGRRAAAHRPGAVQRDGAVREVRRRGRRDHAAPAHPRGARACAARAGSARTDGPRAGGARRSTPWSTATSTPFRSRRPPRSRRRCVAWMAARHPEVMRPLGDGVSLDEAAEGALRAALDEFLAASPMRRSRR